MVVLFDEFHNSPLHKELTAHIYPVEIDYGTVEVKGRLEKRDLVKMVDDISKMRALGAHRYYVSYSSVKKPDSKPGKNIVGQAESYTSIPPRAFVFAYEQKGWSTLDAFVDSLRKANQDASAHIHGLAVLDSDWYVAQEAYADNPPKYHAVAGDALLHFVNRMLHSIGSMPMMQMSIDRYYGRDA